MIKSLRQSLVCQPAPVSGRVNEDACYIECDGKQALFAVIDGASQRLKIPEVQTFVDTFGYGTTASYASQVTRNTIIEQRHLDLSNILLTANQKLGDELEKLIGTLSGEHLLTLHPELDRIKEDQRLLRLYLPACVTTIGRIDLINAKLEFAHVGDTALLLFSDDGAVIELTQDQMGPHDQQALLVAKRLQMEVADQSFDKVLSKQQVQEQNVLNGMYHNYVDKAGKPDRSVGVGVINGLPELEHYIQTGCVALDGVRAVLACSDGFLWPADLQENNQDRTIRLEKMCTLLDTQGVHGYIQALRNTEASDKHLDLYPRFKMHDDATGIYMELYHE